MYLSKVTENTDVQNFVKNMFFMHKMKFTCFCIHNVHVCKMYLQCFKSAKQGKKAIHYNYENDIKKKRVKCMVMSYKNRGI